MGTKISVFRILVTVFFIEPSSNEILTYIQPSLFSSFPPYINFPNLDSPQTIPPEIKKSLLWPTAWGNPGILFDAVGKSADLTILSEEESCFRNHGNQSILGTHRTINTCQVVKGRIQKYMKVKGIAGMRTEICAKDQLSLLLNGLKEKFSSNWFNYILPTFSIPLVYDKFKNAWEKLDSKLWVRKPPRMDSSKGVRVISHWNEINKRKHQSIQQYLEHPFLYNNRKIELRTLVLITSIRPLRVYVFPELDAMKWPLANYTQDNHNSRCAIIRDLINCKDQDVSMAHVKFAESREQAFEAIERAGGRRERIMNSIYSALIQILLFWESRLSSDRAGNPIYYQYLAADWFIDRNFNPTLIEINKSPMLNGKWGEFFNTFPEMFNIIGYHFPPTISSKGQEILRADFNKKVNRTNSAPVTWYNYLRKFSKSKADISKQKSVTHGESDLLENLTPYELYLLAKTEDEFSKVKFAKRIIPSLNLKQYFPIINSNDIYHYKLLHAWETNFASKRAEGRNLLNFMLAQLAS